MKFFLICYYLWSQDKDQKELEELNVPLYFFLATTIGVIIIYTQYSKDNSILEKLMDLLRLSKAEKITTGDFYDQLNKLNVSATKKTTKMACAK
ncbi:hypothetical protein A6V39_01740 [Candidatus Mycoplasma haematobovis]|uniref:Uncharacterized protein n=1 Tax=Candidatus Mycoplasma haematobovis TaxID=432608 RepID=A0A1A9QFL8_9MOLU|nr:hypothetical protein [Candidatus Mycoplasma haematobovis]OAL10765.1 hypothetical protein A6V39_01740 [Candidatus Mycoplasma haematobovis]